MCAYCLVAVKDLRPSGVFLPQAKISVGGGGGIKFWANPTDQLVKGYGLDNDTDNLSLDSDFNLDVAVPAPLSM